MHEDQEIKQYELTFWLKDEDLSLIKNILQKRGVAISAEKPLTKFRLSYPIKKETNAFMGAMVFDADPASIESLTAELNIAPGILRFMISAAPRHKSGGAREAVGTAAPAARGRGGLFRRERPETKPVGEILTNEALEKKIEEISQ